MFDASVVLIFAHVPSWEDDVAGALKRAGRCLAESVDEFADGSLGAAVFAGDDGPVVVQFAEAGPGAEIFTADGPPSEVSAWRTALQEAWGCREDYELWWMSSGGGNIMEVSGDEWSLSVDDNDEPDEDTEALAEAVAERLELSVTPSWDRANDVLQTRRISQHQLRQELPYWRLAAELSDRGVEIPLLTFGYGLKVGGGKMKSFVLAPPK